tara:strand:+ start:1941 stop:2582 length:642 start_codon:yes stop_codon:yes gene_type:complete
MEIIIKFLISYLLGSISGSILIGKIKGVDIRNLGSGNAGGTNAFRTMGVQFAILVLFIDVLKGFLAVEYIPNMNLNQIIHYSSININLISILCGCGAVLGHVYPIYYNFKGGKGAGTMVGILLGLFPIGLVVCLLSWIIILIFSGYVGLSTICAGIILPISTIFYYHSGVVSPFGLFTIFISFFIIFTHRSNVSRMLSGNENRFDKIMIFRKK